MATYCPESCVWETTLACNLQCRHCGSAAGSAREQELTLAEGVRLLSQLAELGTHEVTFSGGEFLLRPDWPLLLANAQELALTALVVSNGLALSPAVAAQFAALAVASVSVSLDGGAMIHNHLRPLHPRHAGAAELADTTGASDSFSQALAAFDNLASAGVTAAAITQVSRANLHELANIRQILRAHRVGLWQIQLTNPMGRLATGTEEGSVEAIMPCELPIVYDFIRCTQREGTIRCLAADNIGYFGRDERQLRFAPHGVSGFWTGCQAGLRVIGITSDGGVRGCLSMPASFTEGNIRELPLRQIWQRSGAFAYNRAGAGETLTGACKDCEFGRLCRAGCHSFAASAVGCLSENTHCIHRTAAAGACT